MKLKQTEASRDTHSVSSWVPKRRKCESKLNSSLLHDLVSRNDLKYHHVAAEMIENGTDVDSLDADGNTLLHVAVENGALGIIEALLKKTKSSDFILGMCNECIPQIMRKHNASNILTLFFQNNTLDFNECYEHLPWKMSHDHLVTVLKTLLQLAVLEKNESAVTKILQCVMKEEDRVLQMMTELDEILQKNKSLINHQSLLSYKYILKEPALFAYLIRLGANINKSVNEDEECLLHLACAAVGDQEAVGLLLKLGADVNVIDRYGNTPLEKIKNTGYFNLLLKYHQKNQHLQHGMPWLLIKHFARLIDAGSKVIDSDLITIRSKLELREFYDMCIEELNEMKTFKLVAGFSCHNVFSKPYDFSLLMSDSATFNQLRKSILHIEQKTFPIFKYDIMKKFALARQMRNTIISRESDLEKVFVTLPFPVIRKIARYSFDFQDFKQEYYLNKLM